MKLDYGTTWVFFASQAEAKQYLNETYKDHSCDFTEIQYTWEGPGEYFVFTEKERCPKGCCWDLTRTAISAARRARELCEEMKELAEELRIARSYMTKVE